MLNKLFKRAKKKKENLQVEKNISTRKMFLSLMMTMMYHDELKNILLGKQT